MVGGLVTKATGIVLDVARQRGGAEPSAVTLHDRSRWGSNGAITGATWVQLPSGLWVLDFDLTAPPDYVEILAADCPQLNFTTEDFSLIARVRPDRMLSLAERIFVRWLGDVDGWACALYNGALYVYTSQTPTSQYTSSAGGLFTAATWATLGFSRSGNTINLFKNGVDVTQTHGTHVDPNTCARSAKIGVDNDLASNPFDGKIAFLRIFSYALSPGQHLQMHEALKRWV